jgi:hypothetical protein
VIYVPLTTQNQKSPYEVELPRLGFFNAMSIANVLRKMSEALVLRVSDSTFGIERTGGAIRFRPLDPGCC